MMYDVSGFNFSLPFNVALSFQFCQYLHENAMYLRPIEHSFRSFQESLKEDALTTLVNVPLCNYSNYTGTITSYLSSNLMCDILQETSAGLQAFADKFKKYTTYALKILPYHLLR